MRGGHLETEIRRDDRITWVVCFFATWSPPCADFTPVFAEISNKFGGLNNLKFSKFDCNLYPDVARKFNVSTSPLSKQLPTVVMYQKGVETKRRPFVDSKNSVYKFIFSYENVVKEFDLNKIYYECKENQIVVKPVTKKTAQQEATPDEVEELSPQEKKEN